MTARPVIVTGAEGFVGRALCRRFAASGREFRALVRTPLDHRPGNAQYVALGDLAKVDPADLEGVIGGASAVVHLAGRAHVLEDSSHNPAADYHAANVLATARVAEAAMRAGAERFIFASTVKVNGESTVRGRPFTPSDASAPVDDYARSKAEAEQRLLTLCARATMVPLCLRLPLVYGPGVRSNFAALLDVVAAEKRLPLAAVENQRSLIGITNLVSAIEAALDCQTPVQGVHFVADTRSVSTPELVRAVAHALDTPERLIALPLPLLRVAALLTGRNRQLARLTQSLEVNDASFRDITDWEPPCTLEEELAATALWWRTRHSI